MTDDEINATIASHANNAGAKQDLIRFAEAIATQRQTANQLAEQSQRLRAVVAQRGAVLDKIETYAAETMKHARDGHCKFALGTVVNMARQCRDTELAG